MSDPFFVVSVPSTGTIFLVNLLKQAGDVFWLHHGDIGTFEYARDYRTFTPLRDPGLALCTWLDDRLGHRHILERLSLWESLVAFDEACNVSYVAVDLRRDNTGLGLKTDWLPVNSKPDYRIRKQYLEGDVSRIDPFYWKRLKALEPLLRPFLERQGYQNLLWWK